ncbi:hypothetical protein PoB_004836300 [Plakobranchus ocellatus]|uniref:Uncharacterized protein n=1 Tax=Plakobranchus ocellatus TaxID=259542 RepID=A0AAV4BRU3_9GAST|nr:hypothetical protein PoB_004836300 [Plakobranchus ocellatus]
MQEHQIAAFKLDLRLNVFALTNLSPPHDISLPSQFLPNDINSEYYCLAKHSLTYVVDRSKTVCYQQVFVLGTTIVIFTPFVVCPLYKTDEEYLLCKIVWRYGTCEKPLPLDSTTSQSHEILFQCCIPFSNNHQSPTSV